ncbi:MAG: hypothetical protein VB142_09625 [Burkholderia sp.]
MVSITSKMMDTTLAAIFAGVYDGHAESLTSQGGGRRRHFYSFLAILTQLPIRHRNRAYTPPGLTEFHRLSAA